MDTIDTAQARPGTAEDRRQAWRGMRAWAGALACGIACAGPAPWFQWRSKLDGRLACAQVSPGSGWEPAGGPYRDADCRQPLRIIRL